jgi:hypothetical protein
MRAEYLALLDPGADVRPAPLSNMFERSDIPIVFSAALAEASPKGGGAENRAQVRYAFTAAAEVYEVRTQTRVTGRCSDLSFGGCYVDTISPFPVGAVVKVHMARELREFEAAAVVAYAHVSMGMGLAFTGMKREHQEVLRSWIAELSGEPAPEPAASSTPCEAGTTEGDANIRLVMNKLIYLLTRKKILTENEASELLREMFR